MPASLPTAPPPLRDAALDAVARLAAELTGLEAAALWLARDAGVPPRWGAFGAPVQWPQLSALATLAHQGAAGADGLSLAQRPVRQALAAPLRGTGGSGLLMAMGFEAGAMPADAPQRLERLAHALGAVQDVTARKQAQEETSRLAMRLTTTLASISDAFVTLDRQGRFLYVNRASEHLLGLGASALLGQPIDHALTGQTVGLLRNELEGALTRNRRTEFEDYYPALGKWLELRAHPYAEGLAVYLHDVTARRRTQEQLMLLETGIARLNDIVLIVEVREGQPADARIAFANDAFERLTGFTRAEAIGRSVRLLEHAIGAKTLQDLIGALRHAASAPLRRREMLLRHRNGASHWINLDVVPVRGENERITHWVAVARDVTERRQADDRIHHLAFYDPLTELPNRPLLMERLQAALADSEHSQHEGALMFIDLDNFKVLNDTLGHLRGDLLLQRVAERLTRCVRRTDTVARIGGDEFVVLLQDLGRERGAAANSAGWPTSAGRASSSRV